MHMDKKKRDTSGFESGMGLLSKAGYIKSDHLLLICSVKPS